MWEGAACGIGKKARPCATEAVRVREAGAGIARRHLSTCGMADGDEVGDEEQREEDVSAAVGASVLAHHAPGAIIVACATATSILLRRCWFGVDYPTSALCPTPVHPMRKTLLFAAAGTPNFAVTLCAIFFLCAGLVPSSRISLLDLRSNSAELLPEVRLSEGAEMLATSTLSINA